MAPAEHFFPDRETASAQAARMMAAALRWALDGQEKATMVVSGGSTPADCLEALGQKNLRWPAVEVLLSDERCVPPEHPDSNAAMVQRTLLQGPAAEASLVPIYQPNLEPDAQAKALSRYLEGLSAPHATALLGMGADGHFASLFPDFALLDEGLERDGSRLCLPVTTAASPHPRITLTLSTLLNSREILLLFFGADKRAVYEQAREGVGGYPVQALLAQNRTPVRVLWAP